ncbi:Condensin complex subunit 2 [Penicillium taxi]|uniref:Condensin complex subunit 2 n=1 Tax=Penicillium taxi TaxID=168475 RepID=UPI00254597AD|nr:Condensin complex subunit 2 [Penicillium taxi]KAJ5902368.1 Condensin complex subunit 2 [Penicillium taxi]
MGRRMFVVVVPPLLTRQQRPISNQYPCYYPLLGATATMPRVVNKAHRRSNGAASTPQRNSPIKIPLNDDMGEKAARMEARQALHDRRMSQIKAAVKTPMPPRRYRERDNDDDDDDATPRPSTHRGRMSDVNGRAVTPMKRVPILANFEEWMKMATDNKINANNSWNFALIDYFHDMSLLKEGDSVNFQKASCTLDGCVKIYTSRVDSVATETGKLLSGLADSRDKRARDTEEDGEDGDEDEEGEDGAPRKSRKKTRSHETTLAPSFSSLKLKKFELEFAVDPLFKKASADFDEGGAKGLLLNHLAIDGVGRIVFDSSDDAVDDNSKTGDGERQDSVDPDLHLESQLEAQLQPTQDLAQDTFENNMEIDIAGLASQFFPDLDRLGEQDICPSLKNFDLGDPTGSLDISLLKAPEDWRQDKNEGIDGPSGIMLDDDNAVGFDDDDASLAGFDMSGDTGFGDGGEVWAREAALDPMLKVHRLDQNGENVDDDDDIDQDSFSISMSHQPSKQDHENILSYFDNALQGNWAGPEHWKIRRIKESTVASTTGAAPKQRKEKEPFEIDFGAPLDSAIAELIYTPASSNSAISLPKTQWKTKGRNLLPDDKHFNSRNLLRLFLKPKAHMGSKKFLGKRTMNRRQDLTSGNPDMNEEFWANHKTDGNVDDNTAGTYDANFFDDDDGLAFPNGMDLDDDDDNIPFADAREMMSPPADGVASGANGDVGNQTGLAALLNMVGATPAKGGYGSQLVTQGGRRARPDYVNYARVAKKVDVRRLKNEMWKGMGERLIAATEFSSASQPGAVSNEQPSEPEAESEVEAPMPPTPHENSLLLPTNEKDGRLRFTHIMNSLKSVYPNETLRDISTSFGFICLLHLANEQGLVLESDVTKILSGAGSLEEIYVSRDTHAILEEGGM